MSQRNVIIGIVVVGVVLVGVMVWAGSGKRQPTSNSQPSTSQQSETNQEKQVLSSQTTSDGLKIEILKEGSGPEVKSGDTVSIDYVGTLENGIKFDSSIDRGTPFETQIGTGQVIKGWDEGVVGMKVGEERKLTIPPALGYGATGAGSTIPPNATLIFDVILRAIK